MNYDKLTETLRQHGVSCVRAHGRYCSICDEAATALSTLQTENERLLAELESVKRERDAAVDCIYQIEDDLDRGNDNDWAREHIAEWESQKEDGHGTALQNDTLCV